VYCKMTLTKQILMSSSSTSIAADGAPDDLDDRYFCGRIARDELHTYPSSDRIAFCCQQNAWMDDGQMLKWIEKVLAPFLQQKPPETEVVLILDMYKVHISESTTAALAALGVTAHIIPGGCTSLVQPVDVESASLSKTASDSSGGTGSLDRGLQAPSSRILPEERWLIGLIELGSLFLARWSLIVGPVLISAPLRMKK